MSDYSKGYAAAAHDAQNGVLSTKRRIPRDIVDSAAWCQGYDAYGEQG